MHGSSGSLSQLPGSLEPMRGFFTRLAKSCRLGMAWGFMKFMLWQVIEIQKSYKRVLLVTWETGGQGVIKRGANRLCKSTLREACHYLKVSTIVYLYLALIWPIMIQGTPNRHKSTVQLTSWHPTDCGSLKCRGCRGCRGRLTNRRLAGTGRTHTILEVGDQWSQQVWLSLTNTFKKLLGGEDAGHNSKLVNLIHNNTWYFLIFHDISDLSYHYNYYYMCHSL